MLLLLCIELKGSSTRACAQRIENETYDLGKDKTATTISSTVSESNARAW